MAYTSAEIVMRAFPDARPQAEAGDGSVDPNLLEQSVADAEAEVNAYIGGMYTLPITIEVPLLTRIATDIAIYRVFTAHPFIPPPRNVETTWPQRYQQAIDLLKGIQGGTIVLVGVDGIAVIPVTVGAAWSSTMRYVPTFGESDDRGFRVDPWKVENEVSRRL